LAPNQKDADELPPYEIIDQILKYYLEDGMSLEEIFEQGLGKTVINKVVRLFETNEYKRRQLPPVLRISCRAFGMGWRMPLARKFIKIS